MRPAQSSAIGMISIRGPLAQAGTASSAGSASIVTSIRGGEDRISVLLGLFGSGDVSLAKARHGLCGSAGGGFSPFSEDDTGTGLRGLPGGAVGLPAGNATPDNGDHHQTGDGGGDGEPVFAEEGEDEGHATSS